MWILWIPFALITATRAEDTQGEAVKSVADHGGVAKTGYSQYYEPAIVIDHGSSLQGNNVASSHANSYVIADPQWSAYGAPSPQPQGYSAPDPQWLEYGTASTQPRGYSALNPEPHGYSAPDPQWLEYGTASTQPRGYSALSPQPHGYSAPDPQWLEYGTASTQPRGYSALSPQPHGYSAPDPQWQGYGAQSPQPHGYSTGSSESGYSTGNAYDHSHAHTQSYSAPAYAVLSPSAHSYSGPSSSASGYSVHSAPNHGYSAPNPPVHSYSAASSPSIGYSAQSAPSSGYGVHSPATHSYSVANTAPHGYGALNPAPQGYAVSNPVPHGHGTANLAPHGYSAANPAPHAHGAGNPAPHGYGSVNPAPHSYGATNPAPLGHSAANPAPHSYSGSSHSGYGYIAPTSAPHGYGVPYDQHSNPHNTQRHEVVYVPVVAKKPSKKKMKIITVFKGYYIPGGTQLFGKFKTLKACQKACALTPTCFAGDYNPWFKKCYSHSNYTACAPLRAHRQLIHFKKIPCSIPEAPQGRVMLGVQIHMGLEVKAKDLTDCIKKCANAGKGVQARAINLSQQICFGIDYNFSNHKCYFHVNNNVPPNQFCPPNGAMPRVPRDAVANPTVISILLCPGP